MNVRQLENIRNERRMPAAGFSVVSVFANSSDASLMAGKGRTEVTYSDWEAEYPTNERRLRFRMMRLTTMGSDAVVQIADAGRVSRNVIRGNDPTRFSAGGSE